MNIFIRRQNYLLLFIVVLLFSKEVLAANKIIEETKGKINDALILSLIEYKYIKDPLLKVTQIKVSSKDGIVKLEGNLNTETEYMQSVYLALSVDNVVGVNTNNLHVKKSTQPLEDTTIASMIYGMLLREKLFIADDFNIWPVKVEVKDGKVYLSGTLESKIERDIVLMTAIRIVGEDSVNDKLLKYKK